MRSPQFLLICLVGWLVSGCDRNKPVPGIPEKKSSFQKSVFTQPQSGSTITLVSETECEIDNRGNILLAEFSRRENKLRVVIRAGGAATVNYFELLPDGLRTPDTGEVFLLPEPLNKYHQQIRAAREPEEARQRAEGQRKEEREKAVIALGHTFNANGYCTRCGWEKDFVTGTNRQCIK